MTTLSVFQANAYLLFLDIPKTIRVVAKDAKSGKQIQISYVNKKVTGNGSFGVVYQTRLLETNEDAAIKKVLQDRRFKVTINPSQKKCGMDHSHLDE